MRRIILVVALAAGLAGCANLQNAWQAVTSSSVDPRIVIVAGNTADALEATATNYLKLSRCNGNNGPVCRSPAVTAKIIPAVRSMRVARNNLEQFLRDHPGQLATQGLYDALRSAMATLQGILTQYNVGS